MNPKNKNKSLIFTLKLLLDRKSTRLNSSHSSPSIGPDLICILDEDDNEDAIDTVQ